VSPQVDVIAKGVQNRRDVPCGPMSRETVYILQSYIAGRGKALKAEPQVGCASADEARRKAERLAPLRLGVVAFAASADIEMGDYDDNPVILFKAGQLPPTVERGLTT